MPLHKPVGLVYTPLHQAGLCGRGGIGRRAALRSLWGNTRESSSLFDRTKPLNANRFLRRMPGRRGSFPPHARIPEVLFHRAKRQSASGFAPTGSNRSLAGMRLRRGVERQTRQTSSQLSANFCRGFAVRGLRVREGRFASRLSTCQGGRSAPDVPADFDIARHDNVRYARRMRRQADGVICRGRAHGPRARDRGGSRP